MAAIRSPADYSLLVSAMLIAAIRCVVSTDQVNTAMEYYGSSNLPKEDNMTPNGASCITRLDDGTYFIGSDLGPAENVIGSLDFLSSAAPEWIGETKIAINTDVIHTEGCATTTCPDGSACMWISTESNPFGNSTNHYRTAGTNTYLTGRFGYEDFTSIGSPEVHNDNRLLLVSLNGTIIMEATFEDNGVPNSIPTAFKYRRTPYSWDYRQCHGARLFHGFQGLALSPDGKTLLVAQQDALFQDGPDPGYLRSSPSRMLLYSVSTSPQQRTTLTLNKTFVYNVSQILERPAVPYARRVSALTEVLWTPNGGILVVENSYTGIGTDFLRTDGATDGKSTGRFFYVSPESLAAATDVTDCESLTTCNYIAVPKRLVGILQDLADIPHEYFLDAAGWGPSLPDGRQLLLTTNDSTDIDSPEIQYDLLILAFAVNLTAIMDAKDGHYYVEPDNTNDTGSPIPLIAGSAATAVVLAVLWAAYLTRYHFIAMDRSDSTNSLKESSDSWWWKNRTLVLVMANVRNLVVSGVIYGYPAFELILRSMGVYGSTCVCGSFCGTMKEGYGIISLCGFLSNTAARPLWGSLMDHVGPRSVSDLGMIVCSAGIACLLPGSEDRPLLILAGWTLLGFGGSAVHLTNFHIQNLFPKNKKPVAALFSLTFTLSAIVFTVWQAVYEYAHVPWMACMGIYLVLVLLLAASGHFLQPQDAFTAKPVQMTGSSIASKTNADEADVERSSSSASSTDVADGTIVKVDLQMTNTDDDQSKQEASNDKATECWHATVRTHLKSGKYWGETLWFCLGFLQFQWYLSSISSQLYQLGDDDFNGVVTDWGNLKYTRAANVFNAFAGLWWPLAAFFLQRKSFKPIFAIQTAVSMVYGGILCAPSLEWQALTFILQSMSRFLLFAAHHAYLSNMFSIKVFGALNAVTYSISSCMTLLIFPLQYISVYYFEGSYIPVNLLLVAINLIMMLVQAAVYVFQRKKTSSN